MRQSLFDTQWLLGSASEVSVLLGLQCGYDYAAEHEWGIRGLSDAFGRDMGAAGLDRTRIRRVPEGRLVRFKAEGVHGLFLLRGLEPYYKQPEDHLRDWRRGYERKTLLCGWDEGSFGLLDFSPQGEARIEELHSAFLSLDISIGGGKGLTFKILSRIPKREVEESLAKDLDRQALEKAALATGIEAELRAAGRSWFALSPRWSDEKKTSVVFWLNPCDQHLYNSGMVTVEDLKLWVQGRGRIMQDRSRQRGVRSRR